jgi:phage head maturation protease
MFNIKASPEDLKIDDYVEWGQSQNQATARGKIVDIRTDGEVNSSISGYTLTGTSDDPVYVIKLLQRDQQGNDVLTEQTVIHRADALRKIPDPIKNFKTFRGGNIKVKGKGIVEGYLVRFGNSTDTDLEKDYFTKQTDFGMEFNNGDSHKLGLYYNHGMDKTLGTKKIGYGTIKMTNEGLWYQAQLDMADEYAKMIYDLAEKGKLGFSSGAASHMVERTPMGKSYEIKRWNLAEASLTPQPAESRNMAEVKNKIRGKSMNEKNYMENMEEHEEIEDMVEGLTKLNVDPMSIANSIFDGAEEDMLFDSINCLTDKLRDGLVAIAEYGKPEDADALLEKFHMMALDVFNKFKLPQELEISEETMMMDMKSISSIKDVERVLRDAGNLSRSQAKQLANLVWNSHRDVEKIQEPEVKTQDDAELRRALLEKAKSYNI